MTPEPGDAPENAVTAWQFETFFEVSLDMLCIRDREGRFAKVNQAWEESLGWTPKDLEGAYLLPLIHPDDVAKTQAEMERVRVEGQGLPRFINRYRHRDGSYRHLEWRARKVGDFVFAVARDVTERISGELEQARLAAQLERALSATEAILDNSHDIICTIDCNGRYVRVNRRAEQLWGYDAEELVGVEFVTLVHPDDRQSTLKVAAQVMGGAPAGGHMNRHLCKDGGVIPMMWSATWSDLHQMIFAVARDMREHLSAEDRLRQSQKMEAVGRLTGGVAHDFNNLLTVIIGSTEALTEALSDDPKLHAMGRQALDAAERGAQLVSRLLAYARNQPLAPESVDCNALLEGVREMVRRTFAEDVEVVIDKAPGGLCCLADATQLTTALLNLCINARDAMPDGGKLTIRAAREAREPGPGSDDRGDSYAVLTVEDTGQGMSDDTRERAAEPFFTTKRVGEGSGLGLSMVYGFVNQSNGRMQIDSELGSGARISIYLPEAQRDAGAAAAPDDALLPSDGARILLVEDDAMVRSQVESHLSALGHSVTVASDGVEALKLIADCREFDLLLTDVVMPNGVNGRELADRARALIPGLRVLLTSGHSQDAIRRGAGNHGGDAFLPKPYRRAALERKLALLLQPSSSASRRPPSGDLEG